MSFIYRGWVLLGRMVPLVCRYAIAVVVLVMMVVVVVMVIVVVMVMVVVIMMVIDDDDGGGGCDGGNISFIYRGMWVLQGEIVPLVYGYATAGW